jgi:hypothetical protein
MVCDVNISENVTNKHGIHTKVHTMYMFTKLLTRQGPKEVIMFTFDTVLVHQAKNKTRLFPSKKINNLLYILGPGGTYEVSLFF